MNYIKNMQASLSAANCNVDKVEGEITEFINFLHGPKFQSTEKERKDWIATGDVIMRLRNIISDGRIHRDDIYCELEKQEGAKKKELKEIKLGLRTLTMV